MGELDLTVATLNLQDGERTDLLPELLTDFPRIDILAVQEGKGWDADGQRRRFEAEETLRPFGLDRSFLTRSTRGTLHEVVFINTSRLTPVEHHTPDTPGVFHDQVGAVRLRFHGLAPVLTARSVQWPHWSGDHRLSEALRLTRCGAPDAFDIIAGDFNSLWPDCPGHDPEFEPDWLALPPHKRSHKTLPPGQREGTGEKPASDRRALTALAEAGLHSAGCLAGTMTPTVSRHADQGQGARIDHIILSPALAATLVPEMYHVDTSDTGSDHRLVWALLDLSRLPANCWLAA